MKRNLTILCLLAAAIRIVGLGSESLWLDEGHTVSLIRLGWDRTLTDATQGPLFLLLTKIFASWLGDSEWALRIVPALFGVAFIPLIFLLAKSLFDERAAFWAALAAAVNPFLIHFSQDARPYSLFLFCGACSVYFVLEVSRHYRMAYLTGFGLSSVAALYCHSFGLFLFPVWLGTFLLVRYGERRGGGKELRVMLLTLGTLSLLYLPLVLRMWGHVDLVRTGQSLRSAWIPVPTFFSLPAAIAKYFFFVPLAAAVLLVIAYAVFAKRKPGDWSGILTCGLVSFCSLVLPFIASFTITPSFVFRYTIQGITGILLLTGWGISRLDRFTQRIVLAGLALLTIFPLFTYYSMTDKDPWREAVQEVVAGYRGGDIIVAQPFYCSEPLEYYLPDSLKVMTVARTQNPAASLAGLGRVWLISAYGLEEAAHTDSMVAVLGRDHQERYRVDMDERIRRNPWGHWTASILIRRFDPIVGHNSYE